MGVSIEIEGTLESSTETRGATTKTAGKIRRCSEVREHLERMMSAAAASVANKRQGLKYDGFVNELSADFYWRRSIKLEQDFRTMLHMDSKRHSEQDEAAAANESKLSYKMSKMLLKFFSRFNHIDLLARDSFRDESNRIHFGGPLERFSHRLGLYRLDRSERYQKEGRFGRCWSYAVLLVWLTCVLHQIVCLVFHYKHDSYKFRLKRVAWLNETHPELYYVHKLETEEFLLEKLAESAKLLESVGSSPTYVSFLLQNVNLAFLIVSSLSYLLARFYYKYKQPFSFDIIARLFDYSYETDNSRKIIKEQANIFIESSRRFTKALVEFSENSIGRRLFLERQASRSAGGTGKGSISFSSKLSNDSLAQIHLFQQRQNQQNQQPAAILKKRHSNQPTGELERIDDQQCRAEFLRGASKQRGRKSYGGHIGRQDEAAAKQSQVLTISGQSLPCRQLKTMVLNDHLMPMNHSPEWTGHLLDNYIIVMLVCFIYLILTSFLLLDTILQLARPGAQLSNAADLLLYAAEMLVLIMVSSISLLFYGSTVVLSCRDQILLANQLLLLIKKLVNLNSLRFYGSLKFSLHRVKQSVPSGDGLGSGVVSGRSPSLPIWEIDQHADGTNARVEQVAPNSAAQKPHWSVKLLSSQPMTDSALNSIQLEDKMNNDLLLVIMHYRLYSVRLLKLLAQCGTLALWAVVIMFMMPIIGRLHQPYFMGATMLHIMVVFCMVVLFPLDLCLVCVCYLHRRCLDLYNELNSVLAHVTDITSQPEGRDIYDRHLVSIIRKELSHHEGMAAKFAAKFAGVSVTYPNLVRIHLYFGFLFLSLISEDTTSGQKVYCTIFSDPFRLF